MAQDHGVPAARAPVWRARLHGRGVVADAAEGDKVAKAAKRNLDTRPSATQAPRPGTLTRPLGPNQPLSVASITSSHADR
jgi:hypothetical protein